MEWNVAPPKTMLLLLLCHPQVCPLCSNTPLWTVPYLECLVRRGHSALGRRVSWREAARGGSIRQELGRNAGGGGDGLGLQLARGRALCQAGEHGPAAALTRRRPRQPHPPDQDRDVRPPPGVAATRGDRLRTRPAP